ncbi:hypothetical protein AVEN_8308-1, partial [Araneus ventricosus]
QACFVPVSATPCARGGDRLSRQTYVALVLQAEGSDSAFSLHSFASSLTRQVCHDKEHQK